MYTSLFCCLVCTFYSLMHFKPFWNITMEAWNQKVWISNITQILFYAENQRKLIWIWSFCFKILNFLVNILRKVVEYICRWSRLLIFELFVHSDTMNQSSVATILPPPQTITHKISSSNVVTNFSLHKGVKTFQFLISS